MGFLAGGVAALLVGVYVLPQFQVGEEGTRVSVRTRDLEVDAEAFSHKAVRSQVTFARAGDLVATAGGKVLPEGAARGAGAWLTADGWVVSFTGATAGRDVVALTSDGRALPVSRRIVDEATGAVFVKIETRDEAAAAIATVRARVGEAVYVVPARGRVVVRRVVTANALDRAAAPNGVESSDTFARRIVLDGALPDSLIGAPLFNARGEMVGLSVGGASGIAIDPVIGVQESVFRGEETLRRTLGIKGIDLTNFSVPPTGLAGRRGFVVTASRYKSIAAGDVINAVGGAQLDGTRSLFELVQEFRPDEEIIFSKVSI